jgi:hypothetical protein
LWNKVVKSNAAQHSVHWMLGILPHFQAFFYAVVFSVWTVFRRPPQRQ